MDFLSRILQGLLFALLLLLLFGTFASARDGNGSNSTNNQSVTKQTIDPAAEGERLFQTNCGRCHKPPDNIPPRISKSILQHMRVRAMLSKEDEELILKYIAP